MEEEPQSSKAAAQGARGPALFERIQELAYCEEGSQPACARCERQYGFLEFGPFVFRAELGALGAFGLSHGTRVGAFGVGGA